MSVVCAVETTKQQAVDLVLGERKANQAAMHEAEAFAATNIALCKYWGKRDLELNLPLTDSLSITLPDKGAKTRLQISNNEHDVVYLNNVQLTDVHPFFQRVTKFLDLFRVHQCKFKLWTESNIPVAAGLASSACGFAALVQALDQLFNWHLTKQELSILARLGSGSASRSLWHGFVHWQAGVEPQGLDSFAKPLKTLWPTLRIGLLVFSEKPKPISSRKAMQQTVATSPLFSTWPQTVAEDLAKIKVAIDNQDLQHLGETAEGNAMAMHALMQSSRPAIVYSTCETLQAMQKIWQARKQHLPLYFTQDAGPNLKLIFEAAILPQVEALFPGMELVIPFRSEK